MMVLSSLTDYLHFYFISGTIQDQVNQCAAYQDADYASASTRAFVVDGRGSCYTGVTDPPNYPADCSSGDAYYATYHYVP